MHAELVSDLSGVHGVLVGQCQRQVCDRQEIETYRKILLVGEDQEESISQLVLVEHALQLLTSLDNTVTIVAVDDEDDTLGVLEVVPPQGADLVLATDIPHSEGDVLVLYRLNVETWRRQARHCQRARTRAVRRLIPTDGRDSRDNFAELELVQDGGLTSGIETDLK